MEAMQKKSTNNFQRLQDGFDMSMRMYEPLGRFTKD